MGSRRRDPRARRAFGYLMLALATATCTDSTAEPEDVSVGPYTQAACPAFGLAATSGLPLERIPIGDLPDSFGSPVAAVLLDDDGEPYGFGYVLEGEGGALELSVPIHPVTPVEGGLVALALTDGTNACAAVDFVITPLPEAEGELDAVVGLLQDVVANQLAIVESTPEELRTTPIEDVPSSLWSLALVQTLLDDPDHEESLLSVSQRDAGDEVLDLADRLLARTGMRAGLEGAAVAPAAPWRTPPARFSSDDLNCAPGYAVTAELLNYCMELAAEMHRAATGLSREVADDIQLVFSELGGGHLQLPYASEVSVLFGAVFFLIYSERETMAAVYPSQLTSISVAVGHDPLLEDDPDPVQIEATVTAASLGYDMQQQILDGLSVAKSLIDTFGDFNFSTGDQLVDGVAAELGQRFARRIRETDIESLQIPAAEFGPMTLSDDLWLDARVVSGDAVAVVDGAHYVGSNYGPATLSVRTKDGKFGDSQLAAQIDVNVSAIELTIAPNDVVVASDEVKTFDVTVDASKYPEEVELDPDQPLQGQAELTIGDNGQHYVTYVAPAEPDPARPDYLVVHHIATTGAREGKPPPRRLAQAVIRFGGLRITTSPPNCVDFGAELGFEVEVAPGIDRSKVRWRASGGDIDELTGAWQAPDAAANVEIEAYLVDSPDVKDSTTVVVGCVCSGLLTVDGISPQTTEVNFRIVEGSDAIFDVGWVSDPVPDDGLSSGAQFEFATPVPFGETLQYEVHGGGLFTDAELGTFFSSDETGPLVLTLSANEGGERVEGTVSGTVHASWRSGPEPEQNHVPLTFLFDVRVDRLLSWSDGTLGYRGCLIGG